MPGEIHHLLFGEQQIVERRVDHRFSGPHVVYRLLSDPADLAPVCKRLACYFDSHISFIVLFLSGIVSLQQFLAGILDVFYYIAKVTVPA